jgi:1,4-dihydroxy-2-naphthoyl-CoA hydrolase
MAFETTRVVRLGHTDAARRMYFARQFDLIHEAYEDWLASEGVGIRALVENPGGGVPIVHAACDYTGQVFAGDELTIRLTVAKRSSRSFTLAYTLHRGEEPVGKATTVHVAVDASTGKAGALPEPLSQALARHLD